MSIANTEQKTIIQEGIIDDNDQVQARVEHLKELENLVGNSYPNKFERSRITGGEDTITNIVNFEPGQNLLPELAEGERPAPEVKEEVNAKLKEFGTVRIAGRLATPPRLMGKAAFVHLSDGKNRLQIYVRRDDVKGIANDGKGSETGGWELFGLLDHGDFVGVEGFLFITNTGELSVHVERLQFLSKALLPMPDKMHGIADAEIRQRQRYADLIGSSLQVEHEGLTTREVFEIRAKVISSMRHFLEEHGYIEVETPMLTPKATGAAAKPFETHHNALDITLYARIAPELYLKRLVVGGFEKVYELNRNFRNEGISYKHNPEFTMLEFYSAYMDTNGMMDFCEEIYKFAVEKATGGLKVKYGWADIDFSKFERLTMKEAVHKDLSFNVEAQQWQIEAGENPEDFFITFSDLTGEKYDESWLNDPRKLRTLAVLGEISKQHHDALSSRRDYQARGKFIEVSKEQRRTERKQTIERFRKRWQEATAEVEKTFDEIKNQTEQTARDLVYIFEEMVESKLTQPTFITDYPKIISPLSKASPQNPNVAERFELFIAGMECANGFSELNDPQEQYERFIEQVRERERGDEEAMVLDEDYIRALAYGMPPAAGIGIGIDRLVMLLTNRHSIRDVILFPHLRPEKKDEEKGRKGEEENGEENNLPA
ncbi:MAG TPA: lysine--tRNA ligase [Pyrinomonadaceae bacterium]|nr:lysine--tRNA ligase [Pyrinomonadaceae bacterium]